MNIFEIQEVTKGQVIVKVNAKDPLTVAKHPYVQADYSYITVTRGKNHIATVIRDSGKTFSWSWGENGYTLVSGNTTLLQKKVMEFIANKGIIMEGHFDQPDSTLMYFNPSFKCWQLSFSCGREEAIFFLKNFTLNDAETRREAMAYACKMWNLTSFTPTTCATGIPIWKATKSSNCFPTKVVEKGKLTFSFDYEFTAKDQKSADEIINIMFDYWYNDQESELQDALMCDIRVCHPETELTINNATVTIE